MSTINAISQEGRTPCSLPLRDADLALGNANWTKGLQSMSDWVWSGHLNPVAFPNNLARYFLQIPGIFEQQLNFSTTLLFDEPSFRNGIQMSGFVDRVCRELVISFIAQKRHCWYSMTHHSVLGCLTAKKHGLSEDEYAAKWSKLADYSKPGNPYSAVEQAVLRFADAFTSDPKTYSDADYANLRAQLAEDFDARHAKNGLWMEQLRVARMARATGLAEGKSRADVDRMSAVAAANTPATMPADARAAAVDAAVVELAFVCLQFVALTGVFTALNIPDESFLAGVMESLLPDPVIQRLNDLCALAGQDMPQMIPPAVDIPVDAIVAGKVNVEPVPLKGCRLKLDSYELTMDKDRDKGVSVGGVQVGTYGWSFGAHFPGNLVYLLSLHPELARYEAPYSLPLLFNEDEWRNGTQTAGFVTRVLKELVYQRVYKTTRSRYGLEHHTMFLYNSCFDLFGIGRQPQPALSPAQKESARRQALAKAENMVLYTLTPNHRNATFTPLERAALDWVGAFLTAPHEASKLEKSLRLEPR